MVGHCRLLSHEEMGLGSLQECYIVNKINIKKHNFKNKRMYGLVYLGLTPQEQPGSYRG